MIIRPQSGPHWLCCVYILALLSLLPLSAQGLTLPDRPVLTPGAGVKPNVIVTFDKETLI